MAINSDLRHFITTFLRVLLLLFFFRALSMTYASSTMNVTRMVSICTLYFFGSIHISLKKFMRLRISTNLSRNVKKNHCHLMKYCTTRVGAMSNYNKGTIKNKRREYETIYPLLLLIKCISTSILYILVYLSKICYSIIVACLILYSLGSDKQPFPLLTFGEHQSVPVE